MLEKYDAFLFDLDNTLVEIDFDALMKNYYGLLIKKLSHIYQPDVFLRALEAGVNAMMRNNGSRTNSEAFFEEFEKHAGPVDEEKLEIFEDFYRNEFDTLKIHARPIPEARQVVSYLKNEGKKVVIATNPVFPRTAVLQRLKWAGLGDIEFDFITTYEHMRACKPNPVYYKQIAEEVDVPFERMVMVGDDPELDVSARRLGIEVILIGSQMEGVVCFNNFREFSRRLLDSAQ